MLVLCCCCLSCTRLCSRMKKRYKKRQLVQNELCMCGCVYNAIVHTKECANINSDFQMCNNHKKAYLKKDTNINPNRMCSNRVCLCVCRYLNIILCAYSIIFEIHYSYDLIKVISCKRGKINVPQRKTIQP